MPPALPSCQRLFVRSVLTLALVSPAILFFLARGLNADRPYTLEIAFTSSVDGILQVFYDRGAGITAEDMARIFDPYFTTRRAGTGLGLPIAKNIIEGLQGGLSVSSSRGAGTEIRIDLPAISAGGRA